MSKRAAVEPSQALQKRARVEDVDESGQSMVIAQDCTLQPIPYLPMPLVELFRGSAQGKGLIQSVQRTSGLQSPIMLLAGHAVSQNRLHDCWKAPQLLFHRERCWMPASTPAESVLPAVRKIGPSVRFPRHPFVICAHTVTTVLWKVYGDSSNVSSFLKHRSRQHI